MSDANELLDSLTDEDVVAYTADQSEEGHVVIGLDRVITVPTALKRVAVQFDHNIETVTFDCPRYWDGIDMSEMNVYINYRRPDGYCGAYVAENVTVDGTDENIIHFDWTITNTITQYKGQLSFLVCIRKADEEGNESNHWNTELNTEMYISEGLECEEADVYVNPDVISHLLQRMQEIEDGLSPEITITDIEGGHRVTIVDPFGTKYFDVMDGAVGPQGDPGQSTDIGLESGSGEGSIQKVGSQAIGPNAIALVNGAIAGCMGYWWSGIDKTNKVIYLSETAVTPVIGTNVGYTLYNSNFSNPYSVGDVFSLINGGHYDLAGTITAISGNQITYSSDKLTFTTIEEDTGNDAYAFFVPSTPFKGVRTLGYGALASGDGAISTGLGAVAVGPGAKAFGDFATVLGMNSLGVYGCVVLGYNAEGRQKYGLVWGNGAKTYALYAAALGTGITNTNENSVNLGKYNDYTVTGTVLQVGCGTSYNTRRNGLVVYTDGRVAVYKDPTSAMEVATKQYVDNTNAALADTVSKKIKKITDYDHTGGAPIEPNAFYDFGEVLSIEISLGEAQYGYGYDYGDDYVNEYRFRFISGEDPTSLTIWYNSSTTSIKGLFTPEANRVYEVSVIDGYLTYQSWEV